MQPFWVKEIIVTLTAVLSRQSLCRKYRNIVFPFSCHFERSEKSLFRPEGEICLRSLAFARDDNPKLRHCDTASKGKEIMPNLKATIFMFPCKRQNMIRIKNRCADFSRVVSCLLTFTVLFAFSSHSAE